MKKSRQVVKVVLAVLALVILTACSEVIEPQQAAPSLLTPDVAATIDAQVESTLTAMAPAESAPPSDPESGAAEPTPAAENDTTPVDPTRVVLSDPNPPLTLPFRDDFETGVSSAWRVIGGNPIVSNGKLGSARGQEVILEIGNNELRDYTIEFSVSNDGRSWGGYYTALYLLLTPSLQVELDSADGYTGVRWRAFEDDSWSTLTRIEVKASTVTHFRVSVADNAFRVHADGQIVSELVYGPVRESGAPLVMRIKGSRLWIDDFVIY